MQAYVLYIISKEEGYNFLPSFLPILRFFEILASNSNPRQTILNTDNSCLIRRRLHGVRCPTDVSSSYIFFVFVFLGNLYQSLDLSLGLSLRESAPHSFA